MMKLMCLSQFQHQHLLQLLLLLWLLLPVVVAVVVQILLLLLLLLLLLWPVYGGPWLAGGRRSELMQPRQQFSTQQQVRHQSQPPLKQQLRRLRLRLRRRGETALKVLILASGCE